MDLVLVMQELPLQSLHLLVGELPRALGLVGEQRGVSEESNRHVVDGEE